MTRERICKKCGESEKEIRKQARFDGATFGCCRVWSGYLFSRHSYAYKDDEGKLNALPSTDTEKDDN